MSKILKLKLNSKKISKNGTQVSGNETMIKIGTKLKLWKK
jgi:hypothetical protein